jgi:tetratricopeptide (TPR) repeat protein
VRVALGNTYSARKDFDRAREHLEAAVRLRREVNGPASLRYAGALNALGALRYEMGDAAAAEELFREVLRVYAAHPGEREQETATTQYNLAVMAWTRGDLDGAEELLNASLAAVRPRAADFPDHLSMRLDVAAQLAAARGEPARAIELMREAVEAAVTYLPDDDPAVLRAHDHFVVLLVALGHVTEAEVYRLEHPAQASD